MSSSLHHTRFLLHLPSLHISLGSVPRTNMKVISCKQVFRLQAINWKPSPCKGMVRRFFSVNQENGFHFHFSEQSAENDVDEAKDEKHKNQNSWANDTNVECSHGNSNGNGNGNGNDKGNKASFEGGGGDEDKECNNQDEFIGIEWWWWWKWHQACRGPQNGATQSPLWPVDAAVQVVANEVMESIEPAVQAIVIEPIRQQLNIKGLIVVIVLGVFVISSIQMVAGLAVMSMGVSLAGVASIVLATLIWWPWKKNGGQRHHNGES